MKITGYMVLQAFRFTGIRFKTTHKVTFIVSVEYYKGFTKHFSEDALQKKYVCTQVVHIFNLCINYQTFK